MALNFNGAGASAADAVLSGLPIALVGLSRSFNLAQNIKAAIDETSNYPLVSEITASLSPQATQVTPAGLSGSWVAGTKQLTVSSTGGVVAGQYIYMNAGTVYKLGRIVTVVSATVLALDDGFAADALNVAYQVAWVYLGVAGQGPLVATAIGKAYYYKFEGQTSVGNRGEAPPQLFYVRSPYTNFVSINGGAATNWRVNAAEPVLNVGADWASRGGLVSLELSGATDLTWWDGSIGEKTMTDFLFQLQNGLPTIKLINGDGPKSATLWGRGKVGSAATVNLGTISGTLDTAAPTVASEVRAY